MAPDCLRRVVIEPLVEIPDLQVLVVTPMNIQELQADDKYCAEKLHVMDLSVKQVLHKGAQMVKRFKFIDGNPF